MCVERIQRIMMAIMVGVVMFLFNSGLVMVANIIGGFMILMMLVWAISDFCPSIWALGKMMKPCDFGKN